MKSMTIREFFNKFPNDDVCLQQIMELRYGTKGIICPSCSMKTNFYRCKSLRAYTCQRCGHHLYPCVGTPFQDSRTSLQFWFYAMYLFAQTRSGVSAKELQRQLGVTYKCAWRMGHKIREYMAKLESNLPLSGIVEVDEAYIGGKRPGKRGRGANGKTVVIRMAERNGKIKTEKVSDLKNATISIHLQSKITRGTHIHTDEFKPYNKLSEMGIFIQPVITAIKSSSFTKVIQTPLRDFGQDLKQVYWVLTYISHPNTSTNI